VKAHPGCPDIAPSTAQTFETRNTLAGFETPANGDICPEPPFRAVSPPNTCQHVAGTYCPSDAIRVTQGLASDPQHRGTPPEDAYLALPALEDVRGATSAHASSSHVIEAYHIY
jgi:hypothetical protein